jgi:cytochrome P450
VIGIFYAELIAVYLVTTYLIKVLQKPAKCKKLTDGVVEYNKPFYHIKLSSQNACRIIFSKKLLRPRNLELGNLFGRWIGKCLGCIDTHDPAWAALKIIFKPIFYFDNKEVMETVFNKWDKHLHKLYELNELHELRELDNNDDENCNAILIEKVINDLPLTYILLVIFGETFVEKKSLIFSKLQKLSKYIMNEIFNNEMSSYTVYQLFYTETNTNLQLFKNIWEDVMLDAMNSDSVKDEGVFMSLYRSYAGYKIANVVTYEMFSQTLIEIIYANHDVTIPSMAWLIFHYAHYGELLKSTKFQSFIEESARVSPIFPESMPKIITSDIQVDTCIIKKGTLVVIDFVEIGKNAEWKMNDLNMFRPDRYDDIEMKAFVSRFGYGGRKCPGYRLANLLFNNILEYLHTRWTFTPIAKITKKSYNTEELNTTLDQSRPFIMPFEHISITKIPRKTISYGCPIFTENELGFVGISVNEKSPYLNDTQCAKNLVLFFKQQNKEIIILIADEIAHYNFQAFNNCNKEKAIKKANQLGVELYDIFNDAINEHDCSNLIKICKWNELNLPDMCEYFEKDLLLREKVNKICSRVITKRGLGLVNKSLDKKTELVRKYVYSELGVLVCGINYNNKWRKLLYYSGKKTYLDDFASNEDSLCNLVEDIMLYESFEDVRNYILNAMEARTCKIEGFIGIDIDAINL